MSDPVKPSESEAGAYRSGVAARLAGVPVNTLRIWERRYAVVGPRLSSGRQRLYSAADIRRLTLIKQLVDMGHPIGTVASVDSDGLAAMRAAAETLYDKPARQDSVQHDPAIRVALISPLLIAQRVQSAFAGSALKVVASCPDPAQALTALAGVVANVVIVQLQTLHDGDLERVASIKAACGAASAIVLYRFAPSALIRRMRAAGHAVARATSDAGEIEAICLGLVRRPALDAMAALGGPDAADAPPPRFDERALAELSNLSRTIECECPRHLVDLVMNLHAFENYSAECASRNPADVALHLDLQRTTGVARAIVEQALARLAAAEGFVPFPSPAPQHG